MQDQIAGDSYVPKVLGQDKRQIKIKPPTASSSAANGKKTSGKEKSSVQAWKPQHFALAEHKDMVRER